VTANVVEGLNLDILFYNENKWGASYFEFEVISRFLEPGRVHGE
jgi:hypothetical protein